jgi:crystallin alpha B
VKLDVQQFAPEEVHVKTVENYVIIEGKHEEKEDPHGFISRHFTRKYHLPEGVKGESVNCNLSSDGILTISAVRELPSAPELKEEGVPVPITHTGKPAIAEAKSKHGKKLK